jgi:hypothetical protein
VIVRLKRAHEIVPVSRIIDDGAQAIAALGQEFIETPRALSRAFIRDGFESSLREDPYQHERADQNQHKENQKKQDLGLDLHVLAPLWATRCRRRGDIIGPASPRWK